MEDDAEQPPCSVTDKADYSADGSVIEISNHTVVVLASLQRLAKNYVQGRRTSICERESWSQ